VKRRLWPILAVGISLLCAACNRTEPEPASADLSFAQLHVTIVRTATDLFLQRFNLTLKVQGQGNGGCSSTTELFPDTGYAGRRNVYLAGKSLIYVVGQFDARIIDPRDCKATLSEFRHLDRQVVFLGSFDSNQEKRWVYVPAAERPELPFEKR
jgi:hypothetical protein